MPTEEEKQRFLQLIRDGCDRATAAFDVNHAYTGSTFRSMCNPQSPNYDAEFAAAYDDAVAERGPLDPNRAHRVRSESRGPVTTNGNGFTKALFLSDDQLEQFLERVRDGQQAAGAARDIDPPTSITQINRRASKDRDFSEAYRIAKEEGYVAFKENLRDEAVRQAFAGDYRALRDQMLMHLDEAKALMTSRHEVGGLDGNAIRVLAERHFHELPRDMLDQLIRVLEEREQRALPAP